MVIYRPHREFFDEAMEEAKVFNSEEEMKTYIAEDANKHAKYYGLEKFFDVSDIVIEGPTVNDDRNGWEDTRYVCVKRFGGEIYEHPQCMGYCATIFPMKE